MKTTILPNKQILETKSKIKNINKNGSKQLQKKKVGLFSHPLLSVLGFSCSQMPAEGSNATYSVSLFLISQSHLIDLTIPLSSVRARLQLLSNAS